MQLTQTSDGASFVVTTDTHPPADNETVVTNGGQDDADAAAAADMIEAAFGEADEASGQEEEEEDESDEEEEAKVENKPKKEYVPLPRHPPALHELFTCEMCGETYQGQKVSKYSEKKKFFIENFNIPALIVKKVPIPEIS